MRRDPRVLLEDARMAAADIEEFTRGKSETDYHSNELLRAAVERKFTVIGEALARLERLDAKWASQISDFRKIVGFRNILVHGYETIDDRIVWMTTQDFVPRLRQEVQNLIVQLENG